MPDKIEFNCKIKFNCLLCIWLFSLIYLPGLCPAAETDVPFPLKAKRILFLGDSITHSGGYVAEIETQLRLQQLKPLPEIINIGLSSETCSGLSEPDHPFPRPDVHTRLDRALEKIKPDVVVACYGMNDGIYHPFDQERFKAYQNGVKLLAKKVHATGARLVLMTPPPFDPVPLRGKGKLKPAGENKYAYFAMYENYNDVLQRYGQWLRQQKDLAEITIDLHTPLTNYAKEQRKQNPKFTLSPDGIHPNATGHRVMAETILHAWGVESYNTPSAPLLKLMKQKEKILHDAWLSEIGHKRPGVKAGLPIDEATAKARELEAKLQPLIEKAQQPTSSVKPTPSGNIDLVQYLSSLKPDELRLTGSRHESRLSVQKELVFAQMTLPYR